MALSTQDHSVFRAFNRFGLGRRIDMPEADATAAQKDPKGFLKSELNAQSALVTSNELNDTKANLAAYFEQQAMKKAMRDGTDPGVVPQTDTSPKSKMQTVQREAMLNEVEARIAKAYAAPVGFLERWVWFWSNHFSISVAKSGLVRATAGSFEREAIRPFVLGNFGQLLKAVEQHPAMLAYLDNRDSIGPDSRAGQRRSKGLNENLAREIMELHTLGVDSGYTQTDVTAFARVITGWTFAGANGKNAEPGVFYFDANRHEPGPQTILGKTYAQNDVAQGEVVLASLAANPATAKHIAFKIARHFVADNPPAPLVDNLTTIFLKTQGDLKALAMGLLDDDLSWSTPIQKFKSPLEFLMSMSRGLGFAPTKPQQMLKALKELGQPTWQPPGPNGYGDTNEVWASPEGLKVRLAYATLLVRQSQMQESPSDVLEALLGTSVSQDTQQTVARAESRQQGLALLFMSPEFQRR